MLLVLLLSGVLVAAQEPSMPAGACTVVNALKGKPAPATSSASEGSIAHGALLYFGGAFAGALYGTTSGSVWYEGGSKFSEPISSASRERAMTMLGISKDSPNSTLVAAPKPNFADVLAPDVRLRGCF